MSKKNFIASLLLFAYTIVLGHSIVPHGHFDDLFSNEHNQNSHESSDHNHHYPFSHSVTLHATLDKQNIYSYQPVKADIKKIPLNAVYILNKPIQAFKLCYNNKIEFGDFVFRPQNVINSSLFSRPPPVFLS